MSKTKTKTQGVERAEGRPKASEVSSSVSRCPTFVSFWSKSGSVGQSKRIRHGNSTRKKLAASLRQIWHNVSHFPCALHIRSSFRVTDIANVGFHSLPKIMGRTGRYINDGLRLISFGLQVKTKKHKHCAKTQHCFGRSLSLPPVPLSRPSGQQCE